MAFLAFTTDKTDLSVAYHGHHTVVLVVLSLLIAVLAAYTSFSHRSLIQHAANQTARYLWLGSGAIAMGLGVWAMHFTGMMSLQLPVNVDYQVNLTLLSLLPAILAASVALYVVAQPASSAGQILGGGVLMGAGIGVMHYTGMAAMVMDAERLYQPGLFIISIAGAVLLATLALGTRRWLAPVIRHNLILDLLSSVVMGLAIASMHYIAMHATVYLPLADLPLPDAAVMTRQTLGTIAVVVAVSILVLATLIVLMRRQVQEAQQSRMRARSKVQQLDQRWQRIASRVPGLVYELRLHSDGSFTFPYASDAMLDLYGVSPEQARQDGMQVLYAIHPEDQAAVLQSINQSAEQLTLWHHEHRVIMANGQTRWLLSNAQPQRDEAGVSWSGFTTDISARKAAEQQIRQLAYYDALTGLLNRGRIQQSLQQICDELNPQQHCAGVLLVDIDNFKRLNDTQGHQAGDELLKQVAGRLNQAIPANSSCGRISSDEFVLLLAKLPPGEQQLMAEVERICAGLRQQLQQPFQLNQHYYHCSFSFGFALADESGGSSAELLKRADIALSQAKKSGGNSLVCFSPAMTEQIQQRYALELALANAVTANQLQLHYQPQLADSGDVIGVEALLRWQHPELGAVSPAQFIPLAEANGQIEKIGDWVLQQACAQLQQWQHDPQFARLTMSVNISARQFYLPEFVSIIQHYLQHFQLAPELLILELTESLVLANLDDAVAKMEQIKQLGVRFSMDDFGTGYSSLSYLSRLPFDEVKIDQYFVRSGSSGNPRDWVIVDAIIGIADTYGMTLVAEGVETEMQRQLLLKSGCRCFQGYLFARPADIAATESWIKSQSR
ncbi:bifunctional diguanylate cyclase/phosphodiesterase [Arsukibacterium indicum]|uniref:EAL domain-containing protein n=1 Tax=Arsukibacterium indicum TaxID=2848612 RepID=A0ABS6MIR1_9GAMM|nr:EAL domain-containing protein [Arsukibacterium indicum]MBV2128697.1 EAL domain-containing protein [Arsukibacterium indicum]